MNRTLLFISILCVFIACKEEDPLRKLHYNEDTIKEVMRDLYIASEAVEKIEPDLQDSFAALYRNEIGELHGVDMRLYEKDMNTLLEYPDLYADLHKAVRDSLVAEEKRINRMKYD